LKVTNAGPPANGFGSAGATTWNGDFNAGGPPVDPPSDIASGLWVGNTGSYELCFNVSSTGAALTQNGSRCLSEPLEDREALYIEFFLFPNCSAFDDNIDFFDVDSNIPIVNNKFRYTLRVDPPFIPAVTTVVEGTFSNGTLSGRVTRTVGSESCTGNFTARPQ
jgi:hypothetical protein